MSDILGNQIEIDFLDQTYVFKIPSINFELEVDSRIVDIRRRATPSALFQGLDIAANRQARYMAIFELYLKKSTTLWPYGYEDSDLSKVDWSKPPVVDSQKFPVQKLQTLFSVGAAFEEEFGRFCADGNFDNASVIPKAVARISHSGP